MLNERPINLSRDDFKGQAFTQHFRILRGAGLNALEQAIISDVLSRVLAGQTLTASKQSLADDFATSLSMIKRTITGLKKQNYLQVNTFCTEGHQRVSEITLGDKAITLLLKPEGQEKATLSVVDPVKTTEVQPTPSKATAVNESIKENKTPEAPQPAPQSQTIPVTPQVVQPTQSAAAPQAPISRPILLNELNASNTSVADIIDVRYPVGEPIAKEDFTKLSLWPAKGRGLSREDVILVLGWSGVIGTQYADQYIASGTMPTDQTRQLEHCRSFASDLRHRLEKIHEEAKYKVDHSWDW